MRPKCFFIPFIALYSRHPWVRLRPVARAAWRMKWSSLNPEPIFHAKRSPSAHFPIPSAIAPASQQPFHRGIFLCPPCCIGCCLRSRRHPGAGPRVDGQRSRPQRRAPPRTHDAGPGQHIAPCCSPLIRPHGHLHVPPLFPSAGPPTCLLVDRLDDSCQPALCPGRHAGNGARRQRCSDGGGVHQPGRAMGERASLCGRHGHNCRLDRRGQRQCRWQPALPVVPLLRRCVARPRAQ